MPASLQSSRMHVGALAVDGRCGGRVWVWVWMWASNAGVQCGQSAVAMYYVCVYEGTTGAPRWEWISMYTGRASAKLRRQGWAGAPADTEGATWTPTPGHAPLHFILALNRPSQALPEPPRHCTSWLASRTRPTALSRDSLAVHRPELPAGRCLPCTAPDAAITLTTAASASHSCCDHEPPRPLKADIVPLRPICAGRKHRRPRVAAGLAPPRWRCAGALSCAHGT